MSALSEIGKEAVKSNLLVEVYRDIKNFISTKLPQIVRSTHGKVLELNRGVIDSPAQFRQETSLGNIKDGEVVTIQSKPSCFGPYLRDHMFSPILGNWIRLGPPIVHPNPAMAHMANTTSMLAPVGLFPKTGTMGTLGYLYPSDTEAFGFRNPIFKDVEQLVPSIPVLMSAQFANHYHRPCHVTGVARQVGPDAFTAAGFSSEDFEKVRSAGTFWILDCEGDGAACAPLGDGAIIPVWGSLYAQGHLEFEGEMKLQAVSEAIADAMSSKCKGSASIHHNLGEKILTMIHADGMRAVIGPRAYSIHMDADLALDYTNSIDRFDSLTTSMLGNLKSAIESAGIELKNPNDVDFTYSNSTQAYTVLQSLAAKAIQDPLAIAIRDWHRLRCSLPTKPHNKED